jgi:hypothetical protein
LAERFRLVRMVLCSTGLSHMIPARRCIRSIHRSVTRTRPGHPYPAPASSPGTRSTGISSWRIRKRVSLTTLVCTGAAELCRRVSSYPPTLISGHLSQSPSREKLHHDDRQGLPGSELMELDPVIRGCIFEAIRRGSGSGPEKDDRSCRSTPRHLAEEDSPDSP